MTEVPPPTSHLPQSSPGHLPCSSLIPLLQSSRRPSVSFGVFGVSGIDIRAIVGELKAVVVALILVVSLLGLAVALSTGTMTPDELNDRTAALIQSATVLIADHMTSIAIGAVATPIALLLVAVLVRPIMDAFHL